MNLENNETPDNRRLREEIITGSFFKEYHITGLELADESLTDKDFYKCSFLNCDLSRAYLYKCRFENCSFDNCDLSLVKLKEAELIDVSFLSSKLIGIDWTGAISLSGLKFTRSMLNHSVFFDMDMRFTSFDECTIKEADFEKANLNKATFHLSDLEGSRFRDTNLTNADFSGARNYNINLIQNRIRKAVFTVPEALSLLNSFDIIIK